MFAVVSLTAVEGAPRHAPPLSRDDLKPVEIKLRTLEDEVRAVKTLIERQGAERAYSIGELNGRLQEIQGSIAEMQKSVRELKAYAEPSRLALHRRWSDGIHCECVVDPLVRMDTETNHRTRCCERRCLTPLDGDLCMCKSRIVRKHACSGESSRVFRHTTVERG